MESTELLPCIEIQTSDHPTLAIIWLHGLGADGSDFASLAPQLDLSGCPGIRFIFPSAPSIPVTVNGGYVMPAWYDIISRSDNAEEDRIGIEHSAKAINALIEKEASRGIAYDKIVLAGFSQGCAMVLHTGLRFPHRLAGIMALSGYLPLATSLGAERSSANIDTPIFMAHGDWDAVIIPQRSEQSRDLLTASGYHVQWKSYAMEHSVHPIEMIDMGHFLRRIFTVSA
ncbi:alpha/beta hydrolase [Polynucleobacter brandtiae]|uniref:Phospholipase/carboxylesterase n=1 Tax=Polynucleobacter brandtiae TaxID=1938816 RepID=A0A2M8VYJ0_9BURK|nr:carboxylesterase [Polynucleobacter brandtiae]PJI82927.1 phospholipase/carboxylesterase [Polynucleobacter brandtiae]